MPIRPRARLVLELGAAAALLMQAGCATVPGQDRLAEKDPLEKVNRGIWNADQFADRIVLKPVAKGYRAVAPRPVRQGVTNFFANLTEPWSFVNNVLQGHIKRAGHNLGRFVVNSTIGVAGLFDHASKIGIRSAPEDLGQTLAVWGFNGGPYLVLPLLGPSTLRDAVGSGVAAFADPVGLGVRQAHVSVWYKRGYQAARVVSARSDLIESGGDAFLESSLDPYAAAKSAYLQHRRAEILNREDDAGPADEPPPAAEQTPTPIGDAAATPPAGAVLPESGAPMPGDGPAPPPKAEATPPSAAPMPGDEAPTTPPKP